MGRWPGAAPLARGRGHPWPAGGLGPWPGGLDDLDGRRRRGVHAGRPGPVGTSRRTGTLRSSGTRSHAPHPVGP
eukprot:7724578-Alexandrium_andersonii.AAC.1